ncbi:unnamed protein product [Camellia sinensis]
MEGQQSTYSGISWADQWDYNNPDPVFRNNKKGAGSAIDKTKAVASNGVKKVKRRCLFWLSLDQNQVPKDQSKSLKHHIYIYISHFLGYV